MIVSNKIFFKWIKRSAVYAIPFIAASPAYAASDIPLVPTPQEQIIKSSAEPSRTATLINQQNAASNNLTTETAQAVSALPKPEGLSLEAAQVTFKLAQIKVEGETVFTEKQLIAPFQSQVGKTISLGDVELMAQAMTGRYEDAGYVLTRVIIPPQYIQNGVVTLRVVEGYIANVSVEGNVTPKVKDLLLKYGERIRASRPLKANDLERYALLVNDLPGISAKIVLRPSSVPAAADLVFVTQESNLSGYFSIDNRGTRFLGPQEFTAMGNINSFFRPGDTTGVQILSTGDKELEFFQVSNQEPLGTNGLQLQTNASYTRSLPGSYLSTFEIKGESTAASVGLNYPFIRSRKQSLYFNSSAGILESRDNILTALLYNDKIRFLTVGAAYDRIDDWYGTNHVDSTFMQGLNIWNASNPGPPSRVGATPGFNKWNFDASRLQLFPKNFSLLISGTGQYAVHTMYAAEQIGFGGPIYGRGYDPSEIVGDKGIEGKLELRYDYKVNEFYTFWDAGDVWNNSRVGQPGQLSAMSTGIGIRSNLMKYLSANLEVAQPLTRTVAAYNDKSTRYYFSVTIAGETYAPSVDISDSKKPLPNNLQAVPTVNNDPISR